MGNKNMSSTQLLDKFRTILHRVLWLVQDRMEHGDTEQNEVNIFELNLCQDLFFRVVAALQCPSRTLAVYAGMYGVEIDQDLVRKYQVISSDPCADVIGDLIDYSTSTFEETDVEAVILDAMVADN